jgi:hypothetical protein
LVFKLTFLSFKSPQGADEAPPGVKLTPHILSGEGIRPDMAASSFQCTQLFNRRAMGSLWERRRDLDASQVRILKSLYDSKKRGTLASKTPITYAHSKSKAGQMGFGRYYGTMGSLETLQRDIRATLCAEYYTDIDIVNCHPTLLVQMAHK